MLLAVTGSASRNNIPEGVRSSLAQRNNVVLREPLVLLATIDAAIPIGVFDLLPLGSGEIVDGRSEFAGTSTGLVGVDFVTVCVTPAPVFPLQHCEVAQAIDFS